MLHDDYAADASAASIRRSVLASRKKATAILCHTHAAVTTCLCDAAAISFCRALNLIAERAVYDEMIYWRHKKAMKAARGFPLLSVLLPRHPLKTLRWVCDARGWSSRADALTLYHCRCRGQRFRRITISENDSWPSLLHAKYGLFTMISSEMPFFFD